MNKLNNFGINGLALLLGTLLIGVPMFGQVDITGVWGVVRVQYGQENAQGPELADYTGIPFNAEGRALGLSYIPTQLAEPIRQCQYYSPRYMGLGIFPLNIWTDTDPVTGKIIAYRIGAWIDKDVVTIWMDGRPHPSPNAFHSDAGFTTGVWDGDTLITRTTHMKGSILRINGAQHSDQATYTQYITRHGDLLSYMGYFEDPVYLEEPFILTQVWQLNPKLNVSRFSPACEPINESVILEDTPKVPHFLPGKNPFADVYAKYYNLPLEAAHGSAATLYPEFRKKLKDVYHYESPEKCTRYCCDSQDPAVKCIRVGDGQVR